MTGLRRVKCEGRAEAEEENEWYYDAFMKD